jgi:hypothetical protein
LAFTVRRSLFNFRRYQFADGGIKAINKNSNSVTDVLAAPVNAEPRTVNAER